MASAETDPDAANEQQQRLPANAEDRKAAAALSSLNANEISQSGTDEDNAGSKISSADAQEALGKAMSRLDISAGGSGGASGGGTSSSKAGGGAGGAGKTTDAEKKDEAVKKKAVKVAAEDVTLLVEELDLTKNKATELLKAHDGDATKAIKAFIAPSTSTTTAAA
ncbi:hypothetical protein VTN96DRAFT_3735 [Rasamsonia emersonii]|uniref:Nascent polypeptide-associated complex subunit alpha-like UBA domain-containing protein n=1 Tax=Rasamsonia emersonii (strain ATCC 16479 / CBS 393.64 / IMI 116815) TaxID=1408163 RepID=A0A0F4YXM9_RASE3|nr:hypothetical protein T310_3130 [Rasamsonia emersonii CBS 393.64]KKA22835.1 hypothetical protein T310_3130 [Rasamsonia emersonii CBS 393.64]